MRGASGALFEDAGAVTDLAAFVTAAAAA